MATNAELVTSELVPSLAVASQQEQAEIYQATLLERFWYDSYPRFATNQDVTEAARQGRLVPVYGDANFLVIGRLRNPDWRERFPPYLLPASRLALAAIGRLWRTELQALGDDRMINLRLAVTSLTRSEQTQQVLIEDPTKLASPESTHCVGAAFDIDAAGYYQLDHRRGLASITHPNRDKQQVQSIGSTLQQDTRRGYALSESMDAYDPTVMDRLLSVVERLSAEADINRVVEYVGSPNQCLHIAPNPNGSLTRSH